MRIPRDLSGRAALCKHWDYRPVPQEGSHIILQAINRSLNACGSRSQRPANQTLNSILRLVATHKGVDKQDVLAMF